MRQVRPDDPMTADLSSLLADLKTKADKATPGPWGINYHEEVVGRDGKLIHADGRRNMDNAAFIAAADPQVVAALAEVAEMSEKHECYIHAGENMKHGDYDCQLCAALARLRLALAGKENSDE